MQAKNTGLQNVKKGCIEPFVSGSSPSGLENIYVLSSMRYHSVEKMLSGVFLRQQASKLKWRRVLHHRWILDVYLLLRG